MFNIFNSDFQVGAYQNFAANKLGIHFYVFAIKPTANIWTYKAVFNFTLKYKSLNL